MAVRMVILKVFSCFSCVVARLSDSRLGFLQISVNSCVRLHGSVIRVFGFSKLMLMFVCVLHGSVIRVFGFSKLMLMFVCVLTSWLIS